MSRPGLFSHAQEERISAMVHNVIFPLEQRMNVLLTKIENVKSNVVVSNTLLERKGVLEKKEFMEEYGRYETQERGVVDGDGRMDGCPIFSLYNFDPK